MRSRIIEEKKSAPSTAIVNTKEFKVDTFPRQLPTNSAYVKTLLNEIQELEKRACDFLETKGEISPRDLSNAVKTSVHHLL